MGDHHRSRHCLNVLTVSTPNCRREESTTCIAYAAGLTLPPVVVLPIRNRPSSIRADCLRDVAQLMVVDRHIYASLSEKQCRLLKLFAIIPGVDPQKLEVADRESHHLHPHECDVGRER